MLSREGGHCGHRPSSYPSVSEDKRVGWRFPSSDQKTASQTSLGSGAWWSPLITGSQWTSTRCTLSLLGNVDSLGRVAFGLSLLYPQSEKTLVFRNAECPWSLLHLQRSPIGRALSFRGVSGFLCACWRRGARRFLLVVREDRGPCCTLICLSRCVWTRVATFFSWAGTSQRWIISVCWFSICFHMEESIWRSWLQLSEGSGSAVYFLSGDVAIAWESSTSEMWTSDRVGWGSLVLLPLLLSSFSSEWWGQPWSDWHSSSMEPYRLCWIVSEERVGYFDGEASSVDSKLSTKAPNIVGNS